MKVSSSELLFMLGSHKKHNFILFTCCSSGELKEIKHDISSLRFELLEREKHDKKTLTELMRQLEEVMHAKQKEKQKHTLDMVS